ncbi:MAG TPA: hypothetical protein VK035_11605 [Kiloniellales bacterium]|nr:hypothetical protein [Kiloniellales bacterium]
MKNFLAALAAAVTLTLPLVAHAYVGPGAGLSLLGALWALLIALGTALLFVVAWPLRKMIRRRRAERMAREEATPAVARAEVHSPQTPRR